MTMKSPLVPVILNEAASEIEAQYLDSNKANTQLNWQPRYGFDEGLRRTIAWYTAFFKEERAKCTAEAVLL